MYRYSPPGGATGGSSIVMVCSVPDALSLGWSFAMLSAAHRDQAYRVQLHEQVTSHPGCSDMLNPEDKGYGAGGGGDGGAGIQPHCHGSVIPSPWSTYFPVG